MKVRDSQRAEAHHRAAQMVAPANFRDSFVGLQGMTMGIDARCGDVKTGLNERVTRSGRDLERELRISHNTARAHLRSMYAKTDVSSRSELIGLINNSMVALVRDRAETSQ